MRRMVHRRGFLLDSLDYGSSVRADDLSGYKLGLVGRQVDGKVGDIVWCADSGPEQVGG